MDEGNELLVKICGIRDGAAAQVAIDSGADLLGFIMAPSKRQIRPDAVRDVRNAIRLDREQPQMVIGVFVNGEAREVNEAASIAGLDAVQLSGNESPAILDDIELPVIKALRFPAGTPLDDAFSAIDAWYSAPRPASRVIVEGYEPGSFGGTGTPADWELGAAIAARYPIILAGGLTPENVSDAVRVVGPAGVDVSSGVETDSAKDHARIRAFIRNARTAAGKAIFTEE